MMPAVQCLSNIVFLLHQTWMPILLLLTTHGYIHTNQSTQHSTAKVERVQRPIVSSTGTSEEWQYFTTRWVEYVVATRVTGCERVLQLLECCDEELHKDLTRSTIGALSDKTEAEVLAAMSLAVRDENRMIARFQLNNSCKTNSSPWPGECL